VPHIALETLNAGANSRRAEPRRVSITRSATRILHASSRSISRANLFTYTIDHAAQAQAELMDGKLLLVTNVAELCPDQIIKRYKALADIERGIRVLESEIEIAPVYHPLPERIRAHAMLCFMALIVYRIMRQHLKLAGSDLSPEKALEKLRLIQRHSVSINSSTPITGISTINTQHASVLAALNIKKPSQDNQLPLL